ncbi:MAG: DUF6512 family protein [candidate division WOR-3 bacterium]
MFIQKIPVKAFLYLIIFSALHFGYDLTGWSILTPFCGIDESIFQHLKMAFWAYLFASLIEYLVIQKRINAKASFWYARLLSTIFVPWFVFLIWYLAPAIRGKTDSNIIELLWAIFSSYLSGIFAGITEKTAERFEFNTSIRIVLIVFIIISAFLFIRFTYSLPWVDMFANPESI